MPATRPAFPIKPESDPVRPPVKPEPGSPFVRVSQLTLLNDSKSVYTYYATGAEQLWCVRVNGGLVGSYLTSDTARVAHDGVLAFLRLDGFLDES